MKRQKRGFLVEVVLFLLVLSALVSGQTISGRGCYTFLESNLYCQQLEAGEVQADCRSFPNCDASQEFVPGSDCSDVPECEMITCNVDCQEYPFGKCQQLGLDQGGPAGQPVSDAEYNLWCSEGCCTFPLSITGNTFCQFRLNNYACALRAQQSGVQNPTFVTGVSVEQCLNTICNAGVQFGTVQGVIKSSEGGHLASATITLEGKGMETVSQADGRYFFPQLTPGTYQFRVTVLQHLPASVTISLNPGEQKELNFTLQMITGTGQISGAVSTSGRNLEGVTVSWEGITRGQTLTNANGQFTIRDLPPGEYVFKASKIGYVQKEQRRNIVAGDAISNFDFSLTPVAFQGVQGAVYMDSNMNQRFDESIDQPLPASSIYIDARFRGFSKHPDGSFSIALDKGGDHMIKAVYGTYTSEELPFVVVQGQSAGPYVLFLTELKGECSESGTEKNVEQFSLLHVPGKEVMRLEWRKPCLEVLGYEIVKKKNGILEMSFSASHTQNTFFDDRVNWGESYSYEIVAFYDNNRRSPVPTVQTMTLGDARCEKYYHDDTGWESFCLTEDRKKVFTCSDQNQLQARDCSALDTTGSAHFCARTSPRAADCKDSGICSQLDAEPFGLYHTKDGCYGTSAPERGKAVNFCYFDATRTIVDACSSCATIKNCFEYQSKEACEINSCLGTSCLWIDSAGNSQDVPLVDYSVLFPGLQIPQTVTRETGTGYCVEEEYEKDDMCALCSPNGELFENYYCTAQVCANLGRCFSNPTSEGLPLSFCQACGAMPTRENNCYAYNTELECTSGRPISMEKSVLTLSLDQCEWGRCAWDNPDGMGSCFKDGDANGKDDCADAAFSDAQKAACRIDNSAPQTTLVTEDIPVISTASEKVKFRGNDAAHEDKKQQSALRTLYYCLLSSEAPEECTPESFIEFPFPGKTSDEMIELNLLASPFLQGKQIPGETYTVRFYSKDFFYNQEKVQTASIFIDNAPPSFSIKNTTQIVTDMVDFTVFLDEVNEPMSCNFAMKPILPAGDSQVKQATREQLEKKVTFSGLKGVIYDLNVTCRDDHNNINSQRQRFTFDLEQDIEIISPPFYGAVKETNVIFEIKTKVGASCELYTTADNQRVAVFEILTEDGKTHRTTPIPGFIEREYAGEYKVLCNELLSNEPFEDFFHFRVDFTPPETQIVLKEGSREVKPTAYGWKEFFIKGVTVDLVCKKEGFDCDKAFYCLGEGCEVVSKNDNYKEFTEVLHFNTSTAICYFSTDVAKNKVYNPFCGMIKIEGYGVQLEEPLRHYFNEEQWGVSATPIFELEFSTRIPTTECRFDFTEKFDYASLPKHKILRPQGANVYRLEEFPASVFTVYPQDGGVKEIYVRCESGGEIGPMQKINLEYDPTPPEIDEAAAEPKIVVEGINTQLFVKTDDKTLCRYSDNSEGIGSREYNSMERPFPDEQKRVLHRAHEEIFTISFVGAKKEYKLNVQCKNAAGNLSEVKEIVFTVDYSQVGNIVSISPQGGLFKETKIPFSVQTTHKAFCEYRINDTFIPFSQGADTRSHSTLFQALLEKEYKIPLRCTLADRKAESEIRFTVDRTAPVITRVDDGNYTCGGDFISVFVTHPNESSIASYRYELYEIGEDKSRLVIALPSTRNTTIAGSGSSSGRSGSSATSSSIFTSTLRGSSVSPKGTLITSQIVDATQPLKILTSTLKENYTYKVKVLAQDNAGNTGQFAESDGVTVVSKNFTACTQQQDRPAGGPVVEFSIDDASCTSLSVQLECKDSIGCKDIKIGQHGTSTICNATTPYTSSPLTFTKTSFLCYRVENNAGKNGTQIKKITFPDADGDGVTDRCDKCTATAAGKRTDEEGCATGDAPPDKPKQDTDTDGLPDYWERIYNSIVCALNEGSADSDQDGVSDNEEDYDNDKATNYQEYQSRTDPCSAEETPRKKPIEDEKLKRGIEFPEIPGDGGKSPLLAWILLGLGILLVFGGSGYLIYYYKQTPTAQQTRSGQPISSRLLSSPQQTASTSSGTSFVETWRQKFADYKKTKADKEKEKQRRTVFSSFNRESASIPHVEKALSKKGDELSRLHELAHHYAENKEIIKPGLRQEEKSIFGKLEGIAQQTKDKDISEIVGKAEAKDIFSRLKELSKKRKGK
ncbi:carboxypeptidase regulatory-like domain-containing protein [Candidatus Woesearchaeota archaeon]|nr:carboxypeptidase regulatory-like domain-containing protein [Candidatus Woesearchaeota archaeon]